MWKNQYSHNQIKFLFESPQTIYLSHCSHSLAEVSSTYELIKIFGLVAKMEYTDHMMHGGPKRPRTQQKKMAVEQWL